jgi:hypothetical protein
MVFARVGLLDMYIVRLANAVGIGIFSGIGSGPGGMFLGYRSAILEARNILSQRHISTMTIHGFFPVFSGYLPDLPISVIPGEAAVNIDSSAVIDWSPDSLDLDHAEWRRGCFLWGTLLLSCDDGTPASWLQGCHSDTRRRWPPCAC